MNGDGMVAQCRGGYKGGRTVRMNPWALKSDGGHKKFGTLDNCPAFGAQYDMRSWDPKSLTTPFFQWIELLPQTFMADFGYMCWFSLC